MFGDNVRQTTVFLILDIILRIISYIFWPIVCLNKSRGSRRNQEKECLKFTAVNIYIFFQKIALPLHGVHESPLIYKKEKTCLNFVS